MDKKALAEATALREKQIQEFHGAELDNIQAIIMLGKHHDNNLCFVTTIAVFAHG